MDTPVGDSGADVSTIEPIAEGEALWRALLAACAAGPDEAVALGWRRTALGEPFRFEGAELLIDLAMLRGRPAAKRALWRTLRSLRRQRLRPA